jgi:hypothetical protein
MKPIRVLRENPDACWIDFKNELFNVNNRQPMRRKADVTLNMKNYAICIEHNTLRNKPLQRTGLEPWPPEHDNGHRIRMDDCTLVSLSLGPRFPYLCSVSTRFVLFSLYPSIFPDLLCIMIIYYIQGTGLAAQRCWTSLDFRMGRYVQHCSRINISRRSISYKLYIAADMIRYAVQNSYSRTLLRDCAQTRIGQSASPKFQSGVGWYG